MTSLRRLERDFVHADMAAVSSLLSQLSEQDVMARFGLEARLEELQRAVARLEAPEDHPLASAALFFGGQPVVGTRGIESEFAGNVVNKFQDFVAKVLAQEAGGLGQRGVVPNKGASTLHITNIVRGSFGFLLEEVQPQQMVETSLKRAVDQATSLLDAFGELDEERFRTAVETIDERVLRTAGEFFDLMRQNGATLRLVTEETEKTFGAEAVARAAERATSTMVEDHEETIRGQLAGVLPEGHQFEFRTSDAQRGTIRGRVDRMLSPDRLAEFNRTWVNVDAMAHMHVKRVIRNGALVRETFILHALEHPTAA
jgi:hypothetical protein